MWKGHKSAQFSPIASSTVRKLYNRIGSWVLFSHMAHFLPARKPRPKRITLAKKHNCMHTARTKINHATDREGWRSAEIIRSFSEHEYYSSLVLCSKSKHYNSSDCENHFPFINNIFFIKWNSYSNHSFIVFIKRTHSHFLRLWSRNRPDQKSLERVGFFAWISVACV